MKRMIKMNQYCRYCSNCIYGDVFYCDEKEITMNEEEVKRSNKCKYFQFCEIDVIDQNRTYKPRKMNKKAKGEMKMISKQEINVGIKPCPFCGKNEMFAVKGILGGIVMLKCNSCRFIFSVDDKRIDKDVNEVIKRFNRRAGERHEDKSDQKTN